METLPEYIENGVKIIIVSSIIVGVVSIVIAVKVYEIAKNIKEIRDKLLDNDKND